LGRNEYLAAENRILKAQLKGRLRLSDAERATLGEIGHRLGRKVLDEVANVARPDTILAWYRKLVARKFDGSKAHRGPGRPRIKREVEQLIVRMAKQNLASCAAPHGNWNDKLYRMQSNYVNGQLLAEMKRADMLAVARSVTGTRALERKIYGDCLRAFQNS
jgi:hypothetical protein